MKPFVPLFLGALLFSLVLSACGSTAPEEISSPEPEVSTPIPVDTSLPPTPQISNAERELAKDGTAIPRALVELAKADLAEQLNIEPDQIHAVESRAVDWPDASLGCPQPDMEYSTVITPGFWILLEAGDMQYPYHTDQAKQVILCMGSDRNSEAGARPVIPVNPGEIDDGQPWVPVD
jgi:hypothetical protein